MAGFDATSVDTTSTKLSTAQALPDVPADGPLLHDAQNFREKFDDTLAAHDLLAVARGEEPPAAAAIVDYPMDTFGALPPSTSSSYSKELHERIKCAVTNKANGEKRHLLLMTQRTRVYALVAQACDKNAKELKRRIRSACDLSAQGVAGCHYDGPRAYRMVLEHLAGDHGRARHDKLFYEAALALGLYAGRRGLGARVQLEGVGLAPDELAAVGPRARDA